jgi:putative hydrolase of the HAD superfamily
MTWLREDDLPDRELLALVGATRDREIRCQVASVQEKRRASYLRHEMAFGTAFDRTLFSCELGFAKPDAAFYLNAQSVLDKQPEELLLVDDSLACIEAAQAAGWHTFHYMGPADRSRLASVLAELVTISHLR